MQTEIPAENWKSLKSILSASCFDRLAGVKNLQAAIDACDPALAAIIMDEELEKLAFGQPSNTLYNVMDEASWWAGYATPAEHKAYCLASFNAMSPKDRTGFLHYVQGRKSA
ncbi:hypothetical protein [Pseudorhodobacter aquimaris]|uniref:hypothetical protein n=1 Tax=Pseudorhodobacter aquimaris TaxID=687412 RepID=UPI00067CF22D|nr:hypothetical protein [Pseudorhodobacter aquimaris]